MKANKGYYKNFITILSGNTISQIIPFVIAPILARLFSPDEFAVFANFMAIATMIGIVAAGRLEFAIPIPKSHTGAQNVAATGLFISVILTLLSASVIFLEDEIAQFYKSDALTPFLWMIPFAVFSIGLLGITNFWILRKGKYNILSYGKITQSLLNNGVAAILGFYGWGVNGLIIGWLASQYLGTAFMLMFSNLTFKRKNYNTLTIKTTLKEYKDFPLINSLHAFTDIFVTQFLFFWVLSSGYGWVTLGLYAMMHKYVRAPIVLITSSVSQIFYKETSEALQNDEDATRIFFKTLKTSGAFSIPFVLVLFFFAPTLFELYLGPNWKIAGDYTIRILPILFFLFLSSPVSGIPILFGKQRKAFLISIINYTFSLSTLVFCSFHNWSILDSLLAYSCVNSTITIFTIFWYYSIVLKHKQSIS